MSSLAALYKTIGLWNVHEHLKSSGKDTGSLGLANTKVTFLLVIVVLANQD